MPTPNFNSRPSARGDRSANARRNRVGRISIHAPPRGATIHRLKAIANISISIHAPPRGATVPDCFLALQRLISIHAPPRGATSISLINCSIYVISIHAPPRGATGCGRCYPRGYEISIHAPPRGATAKDMQFLQIFCSTLTNQHGLTIVPRNLSRLFW